MHLATVKDQVIGLTSRGKGSTEGMILELIPVRRNGILIGPPLQ